MTWVVGAASTLGYAIGLSDVCVTFNDGSTRDCLRKIHLVSQFVALGFAGSVSIGFSILDEVHRWLEPISPDSAWIPNEVAALFHEPAENVWSKAGPSEQALGSHLMMVAVHPTEDTLPGYGRGSIHIFRSPNFEAETINLGKVVSIGSGSSVERYAKSLEGLSADPLALLRGEEMNHKGGHWLIQQVVTDSVVKSPVEGVSSHFHVCVIRRNEMGIWPNDRKTYHRGGRIEDFVMPPVAHTYREFCEMTKASGASAECAVC
jgi:hypothetical protein